MANRTDQVDEVEAPSQYAQHWGALAKSSGQRTPFRDVDFEGVGPLALVGLGWPGPVEHIPQSRRCRLLTGG